MKDAADKPPRYRHDEAQFGRPTRYSEDTAERLLNMLASGQSLKRICDTNEDMPGRNTVYQWLLKNEDFRDKYTQAREIQADCVADNVLNVAEQVVEGDLGAREGHVVFRASTWYASVIAPHKYSERHQVNHVHSGQVEHTHTHEERQQRIAELQAKTGGVIDSTARKVTQAIENKD